MDKMREEFEKLHSSLFSVQGAWCDTDYARSMAWIVWQAAHKAAVPDGYCVVPLDAWRVLNMAHDHSEVAETVYLDDVKDMLAGKLK